METNKHINIAFIDDETRVLRTLKMQFKRFFNVFTTTDPDEFLQFIKTHHIHVAVSDQRMPKMKGVDLLKEVKYLSPKTVRILLTGYADISAIVASLNQGEIYRYLTKPWKTEELNHTISRAVHCALELESSLFDQTFDTTPTQAQQLGRILLIEPYDSLHSKLVAHTTNKYAVTLHQDLASAREAIETQAFQVALIDLDSNEDTDALLEYMKEKACNTVVIAITQAQDSHRLIRLINQRYVYRCLPKPVSDTVLAANIAQAFSRHRKLSTEPKLLFN